MQEGTEKPVVVIGGAGVFGSRLAEGLVRDGVPNVVVAGRNSQALQKTAKRIGCSWIELDLDAEDVTERLCAKRPFVVIDAAGPFQAYGGKGAYSLPRIALAAGAHYFDLSDDATFTAGIAELDEEARRAGLSVLSGVSSVPALSAAAVRALSSDMTRIDLIDSMILPGNRAPRGRSVMAAILAQAGKPLPRTSARAWLGSEKIRIELKDGRSIERLASPIGAPDLVLMPERFGCNDVRFRAGLELRLMHRGLEAMSWLVRSGLLKSASPFLPILFRVAQLLEPFGTDIGAMRVLVRGQTFGGDLVERCWTLTAKAGDGPHVPAIPGRAIVRKLLAGEVPSGARACLDDVDLTECETAAPERAVGFERSEMTFVPLFKGILGDAWLRLPKEVRALHEVAGSRSWNGAAKVIRSRNLVSQTVAWLFGFPPEAEDTPVFVTMRQDGREEVWTRDFSGHRFLSHLRADPRRPGRMWERFGPFRFAIDLKVDEAGLSYPVRSGRFLGFPIPRVLLPKSNTHEAVDDRGRVTFDVALSMPVFGPVVRYQGWLVADQPIMGDQELTVS